MGGWVAHQAARSLDPVRRARRASILPLLILTDLLSAHWVDVPTVDPGYWTAPPETARRLKDNPNTIRVFGAGDKGSGEFGYASEKVDFMEVRDPLSWSLPSVWHLNASKGCATIISSRLLDFYDYSPGIFGFDLASNTHILTGNRRHGNFASLPSSRIGAVFIHVNRSALHGPG